MTGNALRAVTRHISGLREDLWSAWRLYQCFRILRARYESKNKVVLVKVTVEDKT